MKLSPRGDKALVIDGTKVVEDAVSKPKSLKFIDFTVSGSTVYVPVINEDEISYVLRFSAEDGRFLGALRLDAGFYPMKIVAFYSGAFVVTGTTKAKTGALRADAALYDSTGRLLKRLEIIAGSAKDGSLSADELQELSRSLVESSGAQAYFLPPSVKPFVYVLHESGVVDPKRELWSPGDGFVAVNLRASGNWLLVEYVKDPQNDGRLHKYVVYDLFTKNPVFIHEPAEDVLGAFACYDWKTEYTFLLSQNGHRALLTGAVQ